MCGASGGSPACWGDDGREGPNGAGVHRVREYAAAEQASLSGRRSRSHPNPGESNYSQPNDLRVPGPEVAENPRVSAKRGYPAVRRRTCAPGAKVRRKVR